MRLKPTIRILVYMLVFVGVSLFIQRVHEIRNSVYTFPNRDIAIEKIEMIHNNNRGGEGTDESKFVVLKELTEAETILFMSEVYKLETKYFGPPPLWGYGPYIAKVTYENGDIEMLGSTNIVFIKQGTDPMGCGDYYFVAPEFENLFKQFVDIPTS